MIRSLTLFFAFLLITIQLLGQAVGDFQSFQSGNWGTNSTWSRWDGATWVNPAPNTPTNADGVITILNTHTVTVVANVSIDQTIIQNGGSLDVSQGNTLTITDGSGDDLTIGGPSGNLSLLDDGFFFGSTVNVDGQLVNSGSISIGSTILSSLNFRAGSKYQHAQDGATIPISTWNQESTCEITGTTNTAPANLSQSFGNLIWDCASQAGAVLLNYSGTTNLIGGDFELKDTGTGLVVISTTTGMRLTINGNFIVTGSAAFAITTNIKSITIEVNGNYNNTSTGRSFLAAGDPSAPAATTGRLNVFGDFTQSGGELIGFQDAELNLSGSTVQNFVGGATFTNVNLYIKSNAIADFGTSAFTGAGNITVESNSELRLGSTAALGVLQNAPATNGNIQNTGSRIFSAGCILVLNGTAAQYTGNGFPSSGDVNVEIDNTSGVTLSGDLNINSGRSLTITNGSLSIANQTLTIDGSIGGAGTLTGGSNSNLNVGGSDAFTLNFTNNPASLNNFTFTRASEDLVTLGNDLRVLGTFTNTGGTLSLNGNELQISGPYTAGAGILQTTSSSALVVNSGGTGSGFTGNLNFTAGNTIGKLRINRASTTVTTAGNIFVDSLELADGVLNNSTGLTMTNGGTIVRDGKGSMNNIPGGSTTYNVEYIGATAMNTGNELPNSASRLQDLCVNSTVTVTLSKNITINDSALFKSGTLDAGSYLVTMAGPGWAYSGGEFSSTSSVNFTGITSILGSGTIQFTNLYITNTGNITLPTGEMLVSGTYQAEPGAIVDPNGGTLELNGSTTQQLFGGNTILYNITINKSGGDVNLGDPLNVTGTIDIQTATTFNAGANRLTLISSDDDPTQDARIASIISGGTVAGTITVQRHMSGEGRIYRYLSAPVDGATVAQWQDDFPISGTFSGADPSPFNNPSLFYYDEGLTGTIDDRYVAYPDPSTGSSTDPLLSGQGYAAYIREASASTIVDVTGSVNVGDVTLPVSYTDQGDLDNDGWNLVGNPYPSAISWIPANGWTKTNLDNAIYVRDNGNGGVYATYVEGAGTNGGNGRIAIGQAFWVKANGSGTPELMLKELAKTGNSNTFFRKHEQQFLLRFNVQNDSLFDEGIIRFMEEATENFDGAYDAYKLSNSIFNVFSLSSDNKKLAINSLTLEDYIETLVHIGLSNIENGNYEFELTGFKNFDGLFSFIFTDRYTNTITELDNESDTLRFQFSVNDDDLSKAEDRFVIEIAAIITGLEEVKNESIRIIPNPSSEFVTLEYNSNLRLEKGVIIDSQGKLIKAIDLKNFGENNQVEINIRDLGRGLYLLRFNTNDGIVIKKLIVE